MLLLMLLHKCKYEKFRCSSFNMRGSDRGVLVLCFPATHSGVQTFCTANINTKKITINDDSNSPLDFSQQLHHMCSWWTQLWKQAESLIGVSLKPTSNQQDSEPQRKRHTGTKGKTQSIKQLINGATGLKGTKRTMTGSLFTSLYQLFNGETRPKLQQISLARGSQEH